MNDSFDSALRRITITDGPEKEPIHIYEAAELKLVPLYKNIEALPENLNTSFEIATIGGDFIVQVPNIVTSLPAWNVGYMQALLEQFKLAGTTY